MVFQGGNLIIYKIGFCILVKLYYYVCSSEEGDCMKYPNRLRDVRENILAVTQSELSKSLGMTSQNYQRYEYGKVDMKASMILEICKMAGCSADWLICNDRSTILTSNNLGKGETKVLGEYRNLNDEGQEKAMDQLYLLGLKYKKEAHNR
jgi:transcriptional regulator with XRE-family HTH domain